MIISRTPFRISLFGGGTDYPKWYKKKPGLVINATINKYCYINVRKLPPFFNYNYYIRYYKREQVSKISQIMHPSVRECLRFVKLKYGVEIVHNADLPARSGLGSSSTFTVGLLNALTSIKNKNLTKKELSLNSIHIEQNLIKENVGSQDQIAASFGGINRINFGGKSKFTVNPYILNSTYENKLSSNLILIFTGITRNASGIAKTQLSQMNYNHQEYEKILDITKEADEILRKNKNLDLLGELLDEQWKIKKKLSSKISNENIEKIYKKAKLNGAIGCKLLGAGAGGFMLIYARKEKQNKIIKALSKYLHVPFNFDYTGSQIIYFSKN